MEYLARCAKTLYEILQLRPGSTSLLPLEAYGWQVWMHIMSFVHQCTDNACLGFTAATLFGASARPMVSILQGYVP